MHHHIHGITYIYIYIYTYIVTQVSEITADFLLEIKMSLDQHKAIIKWFSKELESEKLFQMACL